MQIVQTNTITHTSGYTLPKERGATVRRVNVDYTHVKEPVAVQMPRVEDFNSLVVIHDKVEYYS